MPAPPVTILGAGIVGICTALSLLERGVPVTLIDRGDPGQETSLGNAGVVSPWSIIPQSLPGTWKSIPKLLFGYGRPLSIHPRAAASMIPWGLRFLQQGREDRVRSSAHAMSHLCGPSIELYETHLRGTGHEALLVPSCYIHAFRDARRASLDAIDYRIRSEMGAELERADAARLREIEPALNPAFSAAIVIKGQARVRSPGRLGQVLAEKVQALGGIVKRADIKRLSRRDTVWEIECGPEKLKAERVIICLGAWSAGLLKELGLRVPLMAERGYHVEFSDPGIALQNSVMDMDAKVVASSMEGGVRVAGQAEFAPVDAPPAPGREGQLTNVAQALFPDLRSTDRRFWMGRRPSFPDSLPMLGAFEQHPGLYANFGHSHYGLMMAPKSGEEIARLLCNEPSNVDMSPYAPSRFHA